MTDGSSAPPPPKSVRWTLQKDGHRTATCAVVPHPLGVELRVDIDGETHLTLVHRQEVDADIHAAALEDALLDEGWTAKPAGP